MSERFSRMTWLVAIVLAVGLLAAPARSGDDTCPGDTNNDGVVNVDDLIAVILSWGDCPPTCPPDINTNGSVNVDDLIMVVLNFGPCPGADTCTTPADCDDDDPCTLDVCVNGVCQHFDIPGCK